MGVKRYASKPSFIYAIQYTGANMVDVIEFAGSNLYLTPDPAQGYKANIYMLNTVVGPLQVRKYDYIVKRDDGFYRHNPDEFHNLYNGVW